MLNTEYMDAIRREWSRDSVIRALCDDRQELSTLLKIMEDKNDNRRIAELLDKVDELMQDNRLLKEQLMLSEEDNQQLK